LILYFLHDITSKTDCLIPIAIHWQLYYNIVVLGFLLVRVPRPPRSLAAPPQLSSTPDSSNANYFQILKDVAAFSTTTNAILAKATLPTDIKQMDLFFHLFIWFYFNLPFASLEASNGGA
jgi:hypothetical protein